MRPPFRRYLLPTLGLCAMLSGCDSSDDNDNPVIEQSGWRVAIQSGALDISRSDRDHPSVLSMDGIDHPFIARQVQTETSENRALFDIEQTEQRVCGTSRLDALREAEGDILVDGRFTGEGCEATFTLRLSIHDEQRLDFALTTSDPSFNALAMSYRSSSAERFYGFGEQYSFLDLKGKRVPVLTQEQGIGRGGQPLSAIVNALIPGTSGDPFTSYFPVPQYVTTLNRGLALANYEFSVFDMTRPEVTRVDVLAPSMNGHLFAADSLLGVVSSYTEVSGRMQPLPEWLNSGAVIGLQGGTDEVRSKLQPLQDAGVPIAAVWLQDWVGQRTTLGGAGKQLWWNWELDESRYPGWDALVAELNNAGTEVMGYINPFLVDVSSRPDVNRNLYQEALNLGYLVADDSGSPVQTTITDFTAGIVDLTNPDARTWLSEVIQTELIGNGFKGWMADFGEALPLEVTLDNGRSGLEEHNRYPERWAQLNAESIERSGAEDIVYFMRAGFTRSPGQTRLFWLGDQATTWDSYDGLQSAVVGLINGGFSGITLNHSDIGGYTSLAVPLTPEQASQFPPDIQIPCAAVGLGSGQCAALARTPELLVRWMEMSAFTAAFRTHEGLSPDVNAQVYSDPALVQSFSLTANVYAALAEYRQGLFKAAAEQGHPVVRHPSMHYPDDLWFRIMRPHEVEFMLGDGFLVAPIVEPAPSGGQSERTVHLPEGRWTSLWTNETTEAPGGGVTFEVTAPLGQPPVWFKADDPEAVKAAQQVQARLAALTP